MSATPNVPVAVVEGSRIADARDVTRLAACLEDEKLRVEARGLAHASPP